MSLAKKHLKYNIYCLLVLIRQKIFPLLSYLIKKPRVIVVPHLQQILGRFMF